MTPICLRSLGLALVLGVVGCPKEEQDEVDAGEEGVEEMTITVEADKSRILQEEQSLQEKRQVVDQERERIDRERAELERKLATLSKKDKKQREKLEADQQRLENEERKLRDRVKNFDSERQALDAEKNRLLEKISQMTQAKGGLSIAQREEIIGRREKDVTRREAKLAEQAKEVAKIQADSIRSLQEITRLLAELQAGSGRTVVVTSPSASSGTPTAGTKASKASVQKLQKDVRTKMDNKGILVADLPPAARDLDKAAKTAVAANDFDLAQQSLTDLGTIVDGIKVDHAFVQGKFTRINKSYPKEKIEQLDEKKRKQVLGLIDEVSDSFSDGRYDRTNKKINQLYRLLEGGE